MAPTQFTKSQLLLILAQLLSLVTFVIGLAFLINTNGGTLFLFAAVAPALALISAVTMAGVAIHRFRQQHSLFYFSVFKPGEVICHEGEEGDCAYFLQSGQVEVLRSHPGRTPEVVAKLKEGQFFGEAALLTNSTRNATIRASQVTQVAVLGKENFLALMKTVPSASQDIMKAFQERAARESRSIAVDVQAERNERKPLVLRKSAAG
jgi:CRP-like cAMP-binding protein